MDKLEEVRPGVCQGCPEFTGDCEGSNQEDCERRPKPDGSRLLGDEEIDNIFIAVAKCAGLDDFKGAKAVAKAQRDLTASIVRAETLKEVGKIILPPIARQDWTRIEEILVALKKGEMP